MDKRGNYGNNNEVKDYYDDYSHDDHYEESKEYGIYGEGDEEVPILDEDIEYTNQMKQIQNDNIDHYYENKENGILVNATVDIQSNESLNEKENNSIDSRERISTFENTFKKDKLSNEVDREEYVMVNQGNDYYSLANDDYYDENSKYLVDYDAQGGVYSNQIENYDFYDDVDYNENNEYSINYYQQDKDYINQIKHYNVYDGYNINNEYLINYDEQDKDYSNQIEYYDVYDDLDYNENNEYLTNYDEQDREYINSYDTLDNNVELTKKKDVVSVQQVKIQL